MPEPTEIVWSDPPPSGWGAPGGRWDYLYDALLTNPGRWAELPTNGDSDGDHEFTLPEKRRRQGFKIATRKQRDGSRKVWLCYSPPAS